MTLTRILGALVLALLPVALSSQGRVIPQSWRSAPLSPFSCSVIGGSGGTFTVLVMSRPVVVKAIR